MSKDIVQFARALDFAARKHAHQRRKGELEEPYINHLAEVTQMLAAATEGRDTVLVVAGLLHDTIEDTETTFDELEARFGREVADLVAEVSDDKSLRKAERKRLQIEKTPTKSDRAKMIKPGFPRWITKLMTCLGDSAIRINAIPSSQRAVPVSPGG